MPEFGSCDFLFYVLGGNKVLLEWYPRRVLVYSYGDRADACRAENLRQSTEFPALRIRTSYSSELLCH